MRTIQDLMRCFDIINCEGLDNCRWSIDSYFHQFNVRNHYGSSACDVDLAPGFYLRVYVPVDELNGSLSFIVRRSDVMWLDDGLVVTLMRLCDYDLSK